MAVSTEKMRNSAAGSGVKAVETVTIDDQHLIDECLCGRTDAFGELVLRYQDRLYNTLVRVTGCVDEARDVAQESFVQAYTKLRSFRGDSAFYSWLFRIAMNAAISRKRQSRRQKTTSLDSAREHAGVDAVDAHPVSTPSHAAELTESQALVRAALDQLSEEFRTALVLKEVEGLKYEEIAEIVDCPIGTVRSRIHRARSELREKLRLQIKEENL